MVKTMTLSQCTLSDIDDLFGLRKSLNSPVLDSWLQRMPELTEREKIVLETIHDVFLLNSDAWNERELSLHFIGPIFALARFTEPYRFNLFAERKIKAIVPTAQGDVELSGEPDGLIATGYRSPKIPMFAFHEYKRELDLDGDPAGQVLAAMLVGQSLNQSSIPIYGCYVVGHYWNFLVLEDKHYTIARSFSALTDEIFDIFRILKALKLIIMDLTVEEVG